MSKTKEQYLEDLEYLKFEEERIANTRKDITECIQRLDDSWAHQEQLDQQERNHE
jgi:hypothetical protein